MPSGYTAKILEGCTFEQFAWSVARGFGALIMMRDDPADAPIPERFEPSDYHLKKIEEAKAAVRLLVDSSPDELFVRYKKYRKDVELRNIEREERDESTKVKYLDMLAKVQAWQPPSPDHAGMKEFMIKQIEESLHFDFLGPEYREKLMMFDEWKAEQENKAECDLQYHVREHTSEVERVEGRNRWLKQLRESLS